MAHHSQAEGELVSSVSVTRTLGRVSQPKDACLGLFKSWVGQLGAGIHSVSSLGLDTEGRSLAGRHGAGLGHSHHLC